MISADGVVAVPLVAPDDSESATVGTFGDVGDFCRFSATLAPPLGKFGDGVDGDSDFDIECIPFGAILQPLLRGGAVQRYAGSAHNRATSSVEANAAANHVPVLRKAPATCSSCGGIAAWPMLMSRGAVDVSTGRWMCVLCGFARNVSAEFCTDASAPFNTATSSMTTGAQQSSRPWPEMASVVDYIDPQAQATSSHSTPGGGYAVDQFVVLVFDLTTPQDEMEALIESVLTALDQPAVPPTCRIAVLAFANALFLYELAAGHSHVHVHGSTPASDRCVLANAEAFLPTATMEQFGTIAKRIDKFCAPLAECRAHVLPTVLRAIAESCPKRALGANAIRSTGAALDMAVGMLDRETYARFHLPCPVLSGHVIAFTAGSTTVGKGTTSGDSNLDLSSGPDSSSEKTAAMFFSDLGMCAWRSGIVVDVLCGGAGQFDVPEMGDLSRACGGIVTRVQSFSDATIVGTLSAALARLVGVRPRCVLRLSRGFLIEDVFGPILFDTRKSLGVVHGDISQGTVALDRARKPFSKPDHRCGDLVEFSIRGTSDTASLSLSIKPNLREALRKDATRDQHPTERFFALQLVVCFSNLRNELVTRVITVALSRAQSSKMFLDSLSDQVCSVLTAKAIVAEARLAGVGIRTLPAAVVASIGQYGSRSWWDYWLGFNHVVAEWTPANEFGTTTAVDPTEKWLEVHLDRRASRVRNLAVDPRTSALTSTNLRYLLRNLFNLRRGPLLSPILQHRDAIDCARRLFLAAPCSVSHLWISPAVWLLSVDRFNHWVVDKKANDAEFTSSEPHSALERVTPDDMMLQSDKILIMDHVTDIYIWSGTAVAGESFDPMRKMCMEHIEQCCVRGRFPRPRVVSFTENSSMARYLLCRLAPAHKDAPDEQIEDMPQLRELTPESLQGLARKHTQPPTDDASFRQYIRSLDRL